MSSEPILIIWMIFMIINYYFNDRANFLLYRTFSYIQPSKNNRNRDIVVSFSRPILTRVQFIACKQTKEQYGSLILPET